MDSETLLGSVKTDTLASSSSEPQAKQTSDRITTLSQASITTVPDSVIPCKETSQIESELVMNLNITQEGDSRPNAGDKVIRSHSNTDRSIEKVVVMGGSVNNEGEATTANSNVNVDEESVFPKSFDEVAFLSKEVEDNNHLPLTCDEVKSVNLDKSVAQQGKVVTVPKPILGSHHLKVISWKNNKVQIVTQNENGPCPLIAIANVLLLRGKIKFPSQVHSITAEQLIEYVASMILDNIPSNLSDPEMLDYERNMQDAIAVLPRLLTGLDVNVKFTGVQDFEFTPECIIFDLLNIPLYHGWLVDPQAADAVAALGTLGYNQLVDKIIVNKSSTDPDLVTDALIAEQFLEGTASQMTYHGLCELNIAMKSDELAVLFRNNHFSTILKKGPIRVQQTPVSSTKVYHYSMYELFQLVTDQGFLQEPKYVWETIINIEGDGTFVDSMFCNVSPKTCNTFSVNVPKDTTKDNPSPSNSNKSNSPNFNLFNSSAPSVSYQGNSLSREQQINQDYLVALSLAEDLKLEKAEIDKKENARKEKMGKRPNETNVTQIAKDAEFALSLQKELSQNGNGDEVKPDLPSPTVGPSNPAPSTAQENVPPHPVTSSGQRKKSSTCSIF